MKLCRSLNKSYYPTKIQNVSIGVFNFGTSYKASISIGIPEYYLVMLCRILEDFIYFLTLVIKDGGLINSLFSISIAGEGRFFKIKNDNWAVKLILKIDHSIYKHIVMSIFKYH